MIDNSNTISESQKLKNLQQKNQKLKEENQLLLQENMYYQSLTQQLYQFLTNDGKSPSPFNQLEGSISTTPNNLQKPVIDTFTTNGMENAVEQHANQTSHQPV